jgi:hypothetical protein
MLRCLDRNVIDALAADENVPGSGQLKAGESSATPLFFHRRSVQAVQ